MSFRRRLKDPTQTHLAEIKLILDLIHVDLCTHPGRHLEPEPARSGGANLLAYPGILVQIYQIATKALAEGRTNAALIEICSLIEHARMRSYPSPPEVKQDDQITDLLR